jgi:hypothetical protein
MTPSEDGGQVLSLWQRKLLWGVGVFSGAATGINAVIQIVQHIHL